MSANMSLYHTILTVYYKQTLQENPFCLTNTSSYQVYKYETGNFFEKIHVYLIKMVIHSIFKVMAIASNTFFPSLWQFVYASPKELFIF